eukprot:1155460-Pelagomonas_calceolata.AAC.3
MELLASPRMCLLCRHQWLRPPCAVSSLPVVFSSYGTGALFVCNVTREQGLQVPAAYLLRCQLMSMPPAILLPALVLPVPHESHRHAFAHPSASPTDFKSCPLFKSLLISCRALACLIPCVWVSDFGCTRAMRQGHDIPMVMEGGSGGAALMSSGPLSLSTGHFVSGTCCLCVCVYARVRACVHDSAYATLVDQFWFSSLHTCCCIYLSPGIRVLWPFQLECIVLVQHMFRALDKHHRKSSAHVRLIHRG